MPILIVALSGRSLAASARRAGAEIIVADFFGDRDTRRMAPWIRLPGSLAAGIDRRRLRAAARALGPLDGIVYGTGFEHAPALLCDLAALAPLIGNTPEAVTATKDPFGFAALLSRFGLPHPAMFETPPADGAFLCKRRGGAGGMHIRHADGQAVAGPDRYYQAVAAGQPISALFVANGRAARLLGLSRQWSAPTKRAPFRYGGCVGPVALPQPLASMIAEACDALAASLGLVGLNSLDMLIEGNDFTILEINPRPGATLDIFDMPLWEWHMRSVAGELPRFRPARRGPARAAAILYADVATPVPPAIRWAGWVADVPATGSLIPAGAPICTIRAEAPDADAAEALVRKRMAALRHRLAPPGRSPRQRRDIAQEHHAAN